MKIAYILVGFAVTVGLTVLVLVLVLKKKNKRRRVHGRLCKPTCTPGVCGGADGCGGQCWCPIGQACVNGKCCTQNCPAGKCGQIDGCGGSCTCPNGQTCINGNCCTPNCSGGKCGDNGCGGTCPACPSGQNCVDGVCCAPNCEGKCGGDGCGGTCTCSTGETCTSDQKCCITNNSPALSTLCCYKDNKGNTVCPLTDATGMCYPDIEPYCNKYASVFINRYPSASVTANCKIINPTWGSHGMYPDTGTIVCEKFGESVDIDNDTMGGDINISGSDVLTGFDRTTYFPLCLGNQDCNGTQVSTCMSNADVCKKHPDMCVYMPPKYGLCIN